MPPKKRVAPKPLSDSESSAASSSDIDSNTDDSSFESVDDSAGFESSADEFVEDAEPLELEEKKLEFFNEEEEPPKRPELDEFNSRMERVEERRSIPILTRYERTRIIGLRSAQLAAGAKPLVKNTSTLTPQQVAELELREKVCPFYVYRPLPNNKYEVFHVKELEQLND